MTRGQVVHYKGDAESNPIGRSNQNPISMVVATELAANIIR